MSSSPLALLPSYIYTEEDIKWFLAQDGVEEIKVESEAGDLVVWDSRTIHFNCAPTADRTRVVVYVCMAPASYASKEVLQKKAQVFESRLASTHWSVVTSLHERAWSHAHLISRTQAAP